MNMLKAPFRLAILVLTTLLVNVNVLKVRAGDDIEQRVDAKIQQCQVVTQIRRLTPMEYQYCVNLIEAKRQYDMKKADGDAAQGGYKGSVQEFSDFAHRLSIPTVP